MASGKWASTNGEGFSEDPSGEDVWPFVTVIAAVYNEERFIEQFVDTMLAQDYPEDRYEVLLIDGGSEDGTLGIIGLVVRDHVNVLLLHNPDRFQPHARNIGIRRARGEIIAVADVHAEYPTNYLTSCVRTLEQHDAWCIGPMWRTEPAGAGYVARVIAIVQSHRFGVGNVYFRLGTDRPRVVDALVFPCMRKSVFRKVGLYDELVPRHEDVGLWARVRRAGGKLLLVPSIQATYYARASVPALLRQAWQTGYETATAWAMDHACTRPRHWAPGVFVASLVALGIASIWVWPARCLLLLDAGAYLLALLVASVHVGITRGCRYVPGAAVVFVLHHFGYGLGTVLGILGLIRNWRKVRLYRRPTLSDEGRLPDRSAHTDDEPLGK